MITNKSLIKHHIESLECVLFRRFNVVSVADIKNEMREKNMFSVLDESTVNSCLDELVRSSQVNGQFMIYLNSAD